MPGPWSLMDRICPEGSVGMYGGGGGYQRNRCTGGFTRRHAACKTVRYLVSFWINKQRKTLENIWSVMGHVFHPPPIFLHFYALLRLFSCFYWKIFVYLKKRWSYVISSVWWPRLYSQVCDQMSSVNFMNSMNTFYKMLFLTLKRQLCTWTAMNLVTY